MIEVKPNEGIIAGIDLGLCLWSYQVVTLGGGTQVKPLNALKLK